MIPRLRAAVSLAGLVGCASAPEEPAVESRFAAASWAPWAKKGWPEAQFGMGLVHEACAEGPEDIDEALDWFRRAGEQGHADANVRRAEWLMARGETGDAIAAWTHAAECGNRQARNTLRDMEIDFEPGSRCIVANDRHVTLPSSRPATESRTRVGPNPR